MGSNAQNRQGSNESDRSDSVNKYTDDEYGDENSRSALYVSAMRFSNIGFEMVVPALIGIGLDRLFGTVVLFVILGSILGVILVFWQLLKMTRNNL